ncbi:MAG: bifunctional folylpolyglutamate synthase/dihydrofolate synthase [Chitinophagaceae bacterium]|nr:bifunctional folylpolyglutamate synthase/dihydrofolate synthase [Chitinophagaceae bacterium]
MNSYLPAYKSTIDFLYAQLPVFAKYGKDAIKPGLDNITALCNLLDNPQEKLKVIHVAGTNGKGSTSHMLAAALQQAGYKTGLYTSPHILDFGERIRVNGKTIDQQFVVDFVAQHYPSFQQFKPSFFEVTVAMALQYFSAVSCDIVVVECGLGGKLDSTNIVTPILSIITNVSYDHMDVLGNTLAAIASEKAGIIKQGIPVVIGEQHPETEQVFFRQAIQKQCNTFNAEAQWAMVKTQTTDQFQHLKAINLGSQTIYDITTDLVGDYQLRNIKTLLTATEVLCSLGYNIPIHTVIAALAHVQQLTGLRGRWDIIAKQPLVIADVAHNPAGIGLVIDQWKQLPAKQKHIVLGFVRDKDVATVLALMPTDHHYYFCNAATPRALPAAELATMATSIGLQGASHATVAHAVAAAMAAMQQDDALLITGSFFVVAEAIPSIP